jgi:hypothetical protein
MPYKVHRRCSKYFARLNYCLTVTDLGREQINTIAFALAQSAAPGVTNVIGSEYELVTDRIYRRLAWMVTEFSAAVPQY